MDHVLPSIDPSSPSADSDRLWRSAAKSASAGVAGAALTNPLDVWVKLRRPLLFLIFLCGKPWTDDWNCWKLYLLVDFVVKCISHISSIALFRSIRNEMFKKNTPLVETVRNLHRELGYNFLVRGIGKNMIAVAIPLGCTIFFTDTLIQWSKNIQLQQQQPKEEWVSERSERMLLLNYFSSRIGISRFAWRAYMDCRAHIQARTDGDLAD